MSKIKIDIVKKLLYILCIFTLFPCCSYGQDENGYFDSGLRLVRSNRRLEDAILKLEQAKKLQPENRQCYLALAAAQAGRAITLAIAESNVKWLERDQEKFRKNSNDWKIGYNDPSSIWFHKSMPVEPWIRTFDDNVKYEMTKDKVSEKINELILKSLENAKNSLSYAKDNAEKAESYYYIGWLKIIRSNIYSLIRISGQSLTENLQEDFEKSIQLNPGNYLYYRSLGDSFFNQDGSISSVGEKIGISKISEIYEKSLSLNNKQPLLIWKMFRIYALFNPKDKNIARLDKMSEKYFNDNPLIFMYRYIYLHEISPPGETKIILSNIYNSSGNNDIIYEPEFNGYLRISIKKMFNDNINLSFFSDYNNFINIVRNSELKNLEVVISAIKKLIGLDFSNPKTSLLISNRLSVGLAILRGEVYKRATDKNKEQIISEIVSLEKEITRHHEVKFKTMYFTSLP
jgi:hypothetical protein